MRLRRCTSPCLIAAIAVFATACAGSGTGPDNAAADSLTALPRALTAAERLAITASNDFALRLLQRTTAHETGNVLLSPLSVSLALGMTMNGAADETLSEMQRTLGWGATNRAAINVAYRDLMTMLPSLDPSVTVRLANGIWMLRPMVPDAAFTSEARQFFNAPVTSEASPRAMFDAVNAWGDRETRGMIPKVLRDEPPRDLVMLLANAVYFAGTWRERFDPAKTSPGSFQLEGGATAVVPMMTREGGFRSWRDDRLVAVELPYGNAAYSMLVLMPTKDPVGSFVATLDTARLAQVSQGLRAARGDERLRFPKFTLEGSLELSPDLRALGMPRAFTNGAQFPRLVANESTKLSFVQHNVKVEVDEKGTRAAAVTVVGVVLVSLPLGVDIDRPFLFLIRERLSGTVLFTGVVRNPLGR
ncbi:serpin family protein [Gemmatimonas sp.]|uniref:serpin family protein n=1 Tax=Gemmatimonas sp. TaxID=1962908 RepID=UPI00398387CA